MFALNKVARVRNKSAKAKGIFQSTVKELQKANKQSEVARQKAYEKILSAKTEIVALEEVEAENNKFISNISKLFS